MPSTIVSFANDAIDEREEPSVTVPRGCRLAELNAKQYPALWQTTEFCPDVNGALVRVPVVTHSAHYCLLQMSP